MFVTVLVGTGASGYRGAEMVWLDPDCNSWPVPCATPPVIYHGKAPTQQAVYVVPFSWKALSELF